MTRQDIMDQYFFWLADLVCIDTQQDDYQQLLEALHDREFICLLREDENRAADGIDLRTRFAEEEGIDIIRSRHILGGPCSVLEMMVGLSCRCEDSIMGDDDYGDRTPEWFWTMIRNLRLEDMDNINYDDENVQSILETMLYRAYRRDGYGGLFYIKHCGKDLRKVEIWYQMCWYLNTIIEY